ncbi:hypothetical protein [Paenibacillus naphthalenovorans]|uniref:hypothetical protein n=1 Tax=Paenibacillus naphthalenovorans TaxID=162209 RepID=UPI0008923CAC|nr:hypothetical protein [Paenibacillus naphthalenovorans]SDJ76903.1 hypothetical protein SAMN05421868_14339 [Paenibacillus naphthalenovorans]
MIAQFHEDSQCELIKPVESIDLLKRSQPLPSLKAIDAWFKSLREGEKGARERALMQIGYRRLMCHDQPENVWQVYELCKAVYELAEIDRVDFNGAYLDQKCRFIRDLIPFANLDIVNEGVLEYHESRQREGLRMQWKVEEEHKQTQEVVIDAAQLNQNILLSFIQHKGLITEFQAYVGQYELNHNGQTI